MGNFDPKVDRKELAAMRAKFKATGEPSYRRQAAVVAPEYPAYTITTMRDFASILGGATDATFAFFMEEKLSFGMLSELGRMDVNYQDFVGAEVVQRGMSISDIKEIKANLREGTSVAEAIGRATGEIQHEARRPENRRSLDAVLDDIAKLGSKWRSLVTMALEAIQQAEGAGGVHLELFEKTYLTRHLIGEQYEFVDQKVKRYLNLLKKRALETAGQSPRGGHSEEVEEENDPASEGHDGLDQSDLREVGSAGETE